MLIRFIGPESPWRKSWPSVKSPSPGLQWQSPRELVPLLTGRCTKDGRVAVFGSGPKVLHNTDQRVRGGRELFAAVSGRYGNRRNDCNGRRPIDDLPWCGRSLVSRTQVRRGVHLPSVGRCKRLFRTQNQSGGESVELSPFLITPHVPSLGPLPGPIVQFRAQMDRRVAESRRSR
jgi:hypothetical protein